MMERNPISKPKVLHGCMKLHRLVDIHTHRHRHTYIYIYLDIDMCIYVYRAVCVDL